MNVRLSRMQLRRLFAFVFLGFLVSLPTLISGTAHAQKTQLFLSANSCAVTSIVLHGKLPSTITCTKETQSISHSLVNPQGVNEGACNGSENLFLGAGSLAYCFYGTGYLAYRVNNVSVYSNGVVYESWVRIYPNGSTKGCFFNMLPGGGGSGTPFDGVHSITQVDIYGRQSVNLCAGSH